MTKQAENGAAVERERERESKSSPSSYSILIYNSINIGDEIQSIAAMRFLPQIDEMVYREQIHKFIPQNKLKTKLIMNAWWMWRPKHFPPSDWIEPLLISMHVRPAIRKQFLTNKTRNYLTKFGPVGCRDYDTYKWLEKENIPAYFSGCLTVTLQRNYKIPRENYILCVDTSDEVVEEIKKLTDRPVYSFSRMLSSYYNSQDRLKLAKLILRLYHDAHLVVSSRLHVIMPSLAMETPVLRIISNKKEMGETSRYKGFENFFNSIDLNNGLDELKKYDFENPLPNPTNHLQIRNELIERCSQFTGYNNTNSLIDENINPFIELCQMNIYKKNAIKRITYWLKLRTLIGIVIKRLLGQHKFDIKDEMFKEKTKKKR